MEIELEDLVITLFSNPPGEPNSHLISFDTGNLVQLFESLLIIFTNGMKLLFGNSNGVVELDKLSEEDIGLFQKYFNSMGFLFYFDVFEDTNDNRDKTQAMKYTNLNLNNNSQLKDLFFPLLSKDKIYLINFNKL
tara:strand:+ start:363 stop:767 length:405 start_codon:yes stop_codon:yes gene_type:complete